MPHLQAQSTNAKQTTPNITMPTYGPPRTLKHYTNVVTEDLLLIYNIRNISQLPVISRAVVNISSSDYIIDKRAATSALAASLLYTGQKAAPTHARKSIAGWKLRKGDLIGCRATTRACKMYVLLDKLTSLMLPRDKQGMLYRSSPKKQEAGTGTIARIPAARWNDTRVRHAVIAPDTAAKIAKSISISVGIRDMLSIPSLNSNTQLFAYGDMRGRTHAVRGLSVVFSVTLPNLSTPRGCAPYHMLLSAFQMPC